MFSGQLEETRKCPRNPMFEKRDRDRATTHTVYPYIQYIQHRKKSKLTQQIFVSSAYL